MTDPRELLARLGPTTVRFDNTRAGTVPTLSNIDIAGALGMVQPGLGRDLLELLHGPAPQLQDIANIYEHVCRLAMNEAARRGILHGEAKTRWGMAASLASFHGDRSDAMRRELAILKARVGVARDQLWPDTLHERMPALARLLIGYMRGERLSNREKSARLKIDESTWRSKWNDIFEHLLGILIDAEQHAARQFAQRLKSG